MQVDISPTYIGTFAQVETFGVNANAREVVETGDERRGRERVHHHVAYPPAVRQRLMQVSGMRHW